MKWAHSVLEAYDSALHRSIPISLNNAADGTKSASAFGNLEVTVLLSKGNFFASRRAGRWCRHGWRTQKGERNAEALSQKCEQRPNKGKREGLKLFGSTARG